MVRVAKGRPQKITQGELLAAPNQPSGKSGELHPAREGHAGLASLIDAQRAIAESVTYSDEELAAMFSDQAREQWEYAVKLTAALDKAGSDPRLQDKDNPLWKQRWLLEARQRYAWDTLLLLQKRGHILVCPVCGIPGIVPVEMAEALSFRGYLIGEGGMAFSRYCEEHNRDGIQLTAKQLHGRMQ